MWVENMASNILEDSLMPDEEFYAACREKIAECRQKASESETIENKYHFEGMADSAEWVMVQYARPIELCSTPGTTTAIDAS